MLTRGEDVTIGLYPSRRPQRTNTKTRFSLYSGKACAKRSEWIANAAVDVKVRLPLLFLKRASLCRCRCSPFITYSR